jgi:hypothetical protein
VILRGACPHSQETDSARYSMSAIEFCHGSRRGASPDFLRPSTGRNGTKGSLASSYGQNRVSTYASMEFEHTPCCAGGGEQAIVTFGSRSSSARVSGKCDHAYTLYQCGRVARHTRSTGSTDSGVNNLLKELECYPACGTSTLAFRQSAQSRTDFNPLQT